MRPVALYARSRSVPAALAALPVVVFLAWSAMRSPWTPLSASLTSLAAVLVITVGLAGQDPELDRSTAVPWPAWRFWHLVLAGVPAAISVLAAIRAWSMPGFMPMLSNHPAVPGIRPPPKNLL